jgi:hypothetical protein
VRRDVVDGAVRDVECKLCGQPARQDLLVLLKPRVEVPPAMAEFTELIVRMGSHPPMLLCLGGSLSRLGSRLAALAERRAPTRPEAR